jgi:nicotinate-nucleotide adenylyltransferase
MQIALLGGSFDPSHNAHLEACRYLLEAEDFDRVWLMPTYKHAFGKDLASFDHRTAMCALLSNPFRGRVLVSEVERNLAGSGVNRTIDTIKYLKAHHPLEDFTFVIGSDNLDQISDWKDSTHLKQEVPFLVLRRSGFKDHPGWTFSRITLPDISSTEIRERISKGEPITGLVPDIVEEYIQEHSLYVDS